MRAFGYAIDVVMVGLVGYALWQHPAVAIVREEGLQSFVQSLPSPLPPASGNATGILIALNNEYNVVDHKLAVTTQQWYNYLVGEDVGRMGSPSDEVDSFVKTNMWKNSLILPAAIQHSLPHVIATWLRNMFAGWALYFGTGGMWALWIYKLNVKKYFPNPADIPSWEDIKLQISVSASAMVFYTLAPTLGEWLIERGWTYCYQDFAKVNGLANYALLICGYMFFVEWAIYWIHRILHFKGVYELLHKPHHIYNNRNSLSPFAGLAFDPVDGLCQASPYLVGLLLLPVHFWTHEGLLFFTAVWTTNIHDTLTGDTEPVMGSAYHTIHHTTYLNNYGQIFVFFDYIHDTLAPPIHKREQWGWKTPTGRDYGVDYDALAKKAA